MKKTNSLTEALKLQAAARNAWWAGAMDNTATGRDMTTLRRRRNFADREVKRWEVK